MREATAEDFEAILAQTKTVLVDFHAPWCGPCKAMEPHLAAIDGEPFPVVKVNIDAEPNLAQSFGIRSVPTLMVLQNGEVKDMRVGAQTPSSLRNWLSSFR